ncbi:MAG: segregation and condensation protein B, partial [Rubritalea sp.]
TSQNQVIKAIAELNQGYAANGRSFSIIERSKGWKIYTNPDYADFVRQLFPGQKPQRLSGPAMETLAIIAYRQPITKAAMEAVRGVSCDGMLQKLLDRELICIGGRAELPGRPLLYETTELFFEYFGIKSVNDLPNASELRTVKLPEPEPEPEAGHALSVSEAEDSSADSAPANEFENLGSIITK